MGMFDWIIYEETKCRYCDTPVTEYQSKSGECELQHLTPEQLLTQSDDTEAVFYGYCNLDWNSKPTPHGNHFRVTDDGVSEAPEYDTPVTTAASERPNTTTEADENALDAPAAQLEGSDGK